MDLTATGTVGEKRRTVGRAAPAVPSSRLAGPVPMNRGVEEAISIRTISKQDWSNQSLDTSSSKSLIQQIVSALA